MSREIQQLLEPLIVSWGSHPTPETTTGSRFIDLFQWTGTKDPTAALTVPTAIQFIKDHDWENVWCQSHTLLRQATEHVCELTHLPPLYPLDSDFYHQMGIAPLPRSDITTLKRRLYDEYKVEGPLIQWQDQQFVRISIQGYNDQVDIDSLLHALEVLLPQVAL